jgi:hypothetical protein
MQKTQILIGAAGLVITCACFVFPVMFTKALMQVKRLKKTLNKFEIVYCQKCKAYDYGKYSLCNDCIAELARQNQEVEIEEEYNEVDSDSLKLFS